MAWTQSLKLKNVEFLISETPGDIPTLAMLDSNTIGWNTADNLFFIEDRSTEPVVIKQLNTDIVADVIKGGTFTAEARTNSPVDFDESSDTNISALDKAIGDDADIGTPQVRTVGPIVVDSNLHTKIKALDTAIGRNVVPKTRTNNPINASLDVTANIGALDAAIGADADITPVTRTNNAVVVNTNVHAKIDALDAAIGADADLVPVTRAVGQLAIASNIYANLDLLDTVVGFDAQMSGTKKNISSAQSIYQNLDALDVYKTVRTVKVTLGWHGATGTDFTFASAADHTAQNIDLGAIVPAKARVMDVTIVCTETLTAAGAIDITLRAGNASAGEQFIASASCDDINEVVGVIDATKPAAVLANWASATNIWIGGDPDADWETITAGKWAIYVTFNDLLNV